MTVQLGTRPVLHILISSALRQELKENEKWELVRPGILKETRSDETPNTNKSYQQFKVNIRERGYVKTSYNILYTSYYTTHEM